MLITRRRALWGLFAAPAIVRASSLMAVVPVPALHAPADLAAHVLTLADWAGVAFENSVGLDGPWSRAATAAAAVRQAEMDMLIYGTSCVRLLPTA